MHNRTWGVWGFALLVLVMSSLGCSVGQAIVGQSGATAVPTRTQRPTWTPARDAVLLATPTLDTTRFPNVRLSAPDGGATPQILVAGAPQSLIIPQGAGGALVQTVVVVIVTATPPAPLATLPGVSIQVLGTPTLTPTPGPPTPTPTATLTPVPPVQVQVSVDKAFVRQGPGSVYPPITQLDQGTKITVVGRNRAGDWWKICCVNGSDVWIAASVVTVDGPLWSVLEVNDLPPTPVPTGTPGPTNTPGPTATSSMAFRLESPAVSYPLNNNIFRVSAGIYNGSTPLWGYKLKVRRLATGEEWLSTGSDNFYTTEVIEWQQSTATPQIDIRRNVKWDSNSVSVKTGDEAWEVMVADGGGKTLSDPVRLVTSSTNNKWFYMVFVGGR
jgi:uncharacterized protein YgiM (DUF1202 family)